MFLNHRLKGLVNCAFDVLHTGPIDLFMAAKKLDPKAYVICALDGDARIAEAKGYDRPINPLATRAKILSRNVDIDEVWTFDNDEGLMYLMGRADVRMIGSGWRGKEIVGEGVIDVEYVERTNDEATTDKIEKYINRRNLLG